MNGKKYLAAATVVAFALLFVTACGKSSSPLGPSGAASTGSPGANITGTVTGTASGSAAGYTKLDNTSGISVTIAGTNLTVAVDSNGKFVFTGVPAGTVQLIFTAGGATSTITLEGVQATDTITIKVTIKGTTAALDTEERNGQTMTELEDQISAINPGGTTRTLSVGTTIVSVPLTASIRHGNTVVAFDTLKVGDRVHVRGAAAGGVFTATEVMVQNTNAKVPVNVSGEITSAVTGSCPAISFVVGGYTVDTDKTTDFQKAACSTVAKGTSVHVKGDVQESGHVLATWVQIGK